MKTALVIVLLILLAFCVFYTFSALSYIIDLLGRIKRDIDDLIRYYENRGSN